MRILRGVPVQTVNKTLYILMMLHKNGSMKAAHIRSALEIQHASMVRLLQTLELDNIIERSSR